jgi:hypothetical protein
VSCSKWTSLDANKLLIMSRNDLVKAVAAVNKNVIVVGECRFSSFAVSKTVH